MGWLAPLAVVLVARARPRHSRRDDATPAAVPPAALAVRASTGGPGATDASDHQTGEPDMVV